MESACGEAFIATSIQAPAQLSTDISAINKHTLLYFIVSRIASLSDAIVYQELDSLKSSINGLLYEHNFGP